METQRQYDDPLEELLAELITEEVADEMLKDQPIDYEMN